MCGGGAGGLRYQTLATLRPLAAVPLDGDIPDSSPGCGRGVSPPIRSTGRCEEPPAAPCAWRRTRLSMYSRDAAVAGSLGRIGSLWYNPPCYETRARPARRRAGAVRRVCDPESGDHGIHHGPILHPVRNPLRPRGDRRRLRDWRPRRVPPGDPRLLPAQAPDPGARVRPGWPPEVAAPFPAPPPFSGHESKLLSCLLVFYREIGPAATPGMKGLDEEAGLARHELDEAVKGLREKGLIEYWALQPAGRLTREGLLLARRLSGGEGG